MKRREAERGRRTAPRHNLPAPHARIVSREQETFRLLVVGSRTAPSRQQTLRATLDWSYGLLSDVEQCVLRRLTVFAGGSDLEAAEVVCALHDVASAEVVDVVGRLIDKSLVVMEDGAGGAGALPPAGTRAPVRAGVPGTG